MTFDEACKWLYENNYVVESAGPYAFFLVSYGNGREVDSCAFVSGDTERDIISFVEATFLDKVRYDY